jgi:N-acetylneuraminic acid mutarotase
MKYIFFLICLLPLSGSGQIAWTHLTSFRGNPRSHFSSFLIDSNYYVIGGFDSVSVSYPETWVYNLNTNTWSSKPNTTYAKNGSGSAASLGHFGLIANPVDSNSFRLREMWRYNPVLDSWDSLSPCPQETDLSIAFTYGSMFYLCFGLDSINDHLNTIYKFDTSTFQWSLGSPLPGSGRDYSSVAVVDSFAYFAGGRDSSYNSINELWRYNITNDSWSRLPDIPGLSRFGALLYAFKNFVLVGFGVYTSPNVNFRPVSGFYMLDLTSLQWSTITYAGLDTPLGTDYSCFQYNKKCYVYGGYKSNSSYYNDLWMFDPAPLGPVYAGVEEAEAHTSAIHLYPIPVRDILHIDGDIQAMDISVTDIVGRCCTAPVSGRDIDVSALPAGVYVLHVSDRGATIVRRFLKE